MGRDGRDVGIVRVRGVQNWAWLVGGRLLVVCLLGGFRKLQADGHESAGAVVIQQRGRRRLVTALISATVVENLLLGFCVFRALDVRPGLGMPVFDAAVVFVAGRGVAVAQEHPHAGVHTARQTQSRPGSRLVSSVPPGKSVVSVGTRKLRWFSI